MNRNDWHKIREDIQAIYYHCQPIGTVCLASVVINGETRTARGIALVHPNDQFCRKTGRIKAL